MRERFEGDAGRRLLANELADQVIVHGNHDIATELLRVSELRELQTGDILLAQGSEENDIYFIISGSVNVEANGRVVAVRNSRTHVGEMSLIDSKASRCATVKASEKTVVAKVTESEFSRIAADF